MVLLVMVADLNIVIVTNRLLKDNKMEFQVFNEYAIQLFKTDKKHVVISVRSPNTKEIVLPYQTSRLDALFFKFHDIDERALRLTKREDCKVCKGTGLIPKWKHIEGGKCFSCNKEELNLVLFTPENAKAILEFTKFYLSKVELVAVNCEAGISRSSAIAGALSKIFNNTDEYFFKNYCPNSLVYRTILEVHFGEPQRN